MLARPEKKREVLHATMVGVPAKMEWPDRVNAVGAQQAAAKKVAAEVLRLAQEAERLERLRRVEAAPIELKRLLPATLLRDARKWTQFPAKGDPFDSDALRAYVRSSFTNYGSIRDELTRDERRSDIGRRLKSRVTEFINRAIADWKRQHPEIVAAESAARPTKTVSSAAA